MKFHELYDWFLMASTTEVISYGDHHWSNKKNLTSWFLMKSTIEVVRRSGIFNIILVELKEIKFYDWILMESTIVAVKTFGMFNTRMGLKELKFYVIFYIIDFLWGTPWN